jgi:pyridoxamine 5'-phosphate oxidase family protein
MTFTEIAADYVRTQDLGRLASVQPDSTVQVSPVGFRHNIDLATIDIGRLHLAASQKFRNLTSNDRVAFVVDDVVSRQPRRVRCLEMPDR